MKFRKFGQVLMALVAFAVLGFGVTSCTNSYTVAFMYVTGSQYNQIGGFKVDNNAGKLTRIDKSPFGANGTNPIKELVLAGGRFLYVLNAGDPANGVNGNISLFQIGGYGALSFQASYFSQGSNPVSILTDSSGAHIYVLDEYAPTGTASNAISPGTPCLNQANGLYYPTGEVTAFSVDSGTGRLSLIQNQQVKDQNGTLLTYFPLGCFPTEFKLAGGNLFTIQQGSTTNNDVQTVFSYALNATNGQLTLTQNAPLATGAAHLTYINGDPGGKYIYLLDAGPVSCTSNGVTSSTQILPFTIGTNGTLQSLVGGNVCNDPSAVNPNLLLVDSKSKFLYVSNSGPNTGITNPASEITAFNIDPTTGRLAFIAGQPFSTGSGPRCIIEDPSNQFVYLANFNDSTVVGKIIDTNAGSLNPLRSATSFPTVGNPTWCVASGRVQ